jgi:hypothetical protein
MEQRRATLILLLIPAGLFLLSLILHNARGPYYLGYNTDPSYVYLFNSLNVALLKGPLHFDHPGTPVQIIGAIILLIKWSLSFITGNLLGFTDSVLLYPESYLRVINIVLNILISIGAFYAAYKLLLTTNSLLTSLIVQISLLSYLIIFAVQTDVSPEPLLVFLTLLLMIPIISLVFSSLSCNEAGELNIAKIVGIIVGFGLAAKVTYFPFIILLWLFNNKKSRLVFLICCLLSFILFTAPIFLQLPRLLKWLLSLAIYSGAYGSGNPGLPSAAQLFNTFILLIRGEPFIFIILLYYILIVSFMHYCTIRVNNMVKVQATKILWISIFIIIIQIMAAVKSPGLRSTYIIPCIVFTALTNAIIAFIFIKTGQWKLFHIIFAIIGVTLAIAGPIYNIFQIKKWVGTKTKYQQEALQLDMIQKTMHDCTVIACFNSSIPQFALSFGNQFVNDQYGEKLAQLYPHAPFFYNFSNNEFYSFRDLISRVTIIEKLKNNDCIIVRSRLAKRFDSDLVLEPIIEKTDEAIYRLKGFKQKNK